MQKYTVFALIYFDYAKLTFNAPPLGVKGGPGGVSPGVRPVQVLY